jgi:hypothetical protein
VGTAEGRRFDEVNAGGGGGVLMALHTSVSGWERRGWRPFCRLCSKIRTSCSHLQMELNCGKTLSVSSVMNPEFVSMMRDCRVGTKN